jgi:hypothetical protein
VGGRIYLGHIDVDNRCETLKSNVYIRSRCVCPVRLPHMLTAMRELGNNEDRGASAFVGPALLPVIL